MLAQIHKYIIGTSTDYKALLFDLVEKFRQHIRLYNIKNSRTAAIHSAFPAGTPEQTNDKPPRNPSFQGKSNNLPKKECIYGKLEWYNNCDYLYPDRPGGPGKSFKPDPVIKKKVEEAIKNLQTKINVERTLKKAKE